VLPGLTHPGDVLVGSQAVAYHCSQVDSDPLADAAYLEEINSRGKDLAPLLLMHYYQAAEVRGAAGLDAAGLDAAGRSFAATVPQHMSSGFRCRWRRSDQ
jgi:hypothetical protein